MNDFIFYFKLGIDHILTWEAMDHLLFIAALTLNYQHREWKKIVVLVTSFTLGHAISLALTVVGWIVVSVKWVEFLVPVTIALTAIVNIAQKRYTSIPRARITYALALGFGIIHGMAFASTFNMFEGSDGLFIHLLAFNSGIECAQILIVFFVLLISYLVIHYLPFSQLHWIRFASLVILVFSLKMCIERFPARGPIVVRTNSLSSTKILYTTVI